MAKAKSTTTSNSKHREKPKRKRPGIHAKSKASRHKASKNYKKRYVGQGR